MYFFALIQTESYKYNIFLTNSILWKDLNLVILKCTSEDSRQNPQCEKEVMNTSYMSQQASCSFRSSYAKVHCSVIIFINFYPYMIELISMDLPCMNRKIYIQSYITNDDKLRSITEGALVRA
jgi:hypothetical protein